MTVESQHDIDGVLNAGRVVACVRDAMLNAIEPGMTTAELDKLGGELLDRFGAKSAPRVTYNFPGATCMKSRRASSATLIVATHADYSSVK